MLVHDSGWSAAGALAPIHRYKEARMLASGIDNSAKMSAYLSCGCVSARTIHKAVLAADSARGALPGEGPGNTLLLHLMIRYCPHVACRHVCSKGMKGSRLVSEGEQSLFRPSTLHPYMYAQGF